MQPLQGCASCSWRLPVPHSDGTTHTNGGRHPSKPHIANSWNKSSSGERVGPSHAKKKLGAARGMVGKHGMGEVMGAAPPNGRRGVEEVVERDPAEFPSSAQSGVRPAGLKNKEVHTLRRMPMAAVFLKGQGRASTSRQVTAMLTKDHFASVLTRSKTSALLHHSSPC